jgi:hypothetical protein
MMIKIKYGVALLIVMLGVTVSCKKDDEPSPPIPPRDRGEEAVRAQAEIETFLETHFYNYEEFQNPPADFDYLVKFDTIAGDNASKTPLMDQVTSKQVKDVVDTDVTYKLYYLKVREGGGEKPHFSDFAMTNYDGRLMNLDLFDSSVVPVRFDLTEIIKGLQAAMIEFRGAEGDPIINPDGTLTFENYGVGAVFIPSGLGYYQYPPGNKGLDAYGQLIFSFQLFSSTVADHDKDGIPSYLEDRNGNQFLLDDDTDGDGVANYQDTDDDGDGRLTKYEIEIDEEGNITYPDADGDGIPDYLDKDS